MDANNEEDLERFKSLMFLNDNRKIAIIEDSNPEVARIILTREWQGHPDEARQMLDRISDKWPNGKRVKFIITPGGFLQFDWPCTLGRNEIGDNKSPNSGAVNCLVEEAKKCANYALDDGIREKLLQFADYITFGVDSRKNKVSTTHNYIGQLHAELVILVDLKNKGVYWSGKSYPTTSQQHGLVRIMDLATHFFDLDVGKTMVLGCHDLTVFNPRSKNAVGWRKKSK